MKEIKSLKNEYIKELKKLQDKKYRDLNKMFLVEGYHLVEEASKHNKLQIVLITNMNDYVDGVENILVTEEIIINLSKTKSPQLIIGVVSYFEEAMLDDEKYLILDDIQDPGNLGTLVRSALGFGIGTVILSDNSVDIYNDKFIRSTQGAIFKIKFIKMDLKTAINELKKKNVFILGTALDGEKLFDFIVESRYAIVLGNEGNGISKEVLELTDKNVRIEMEDDLESLNVAVAGSIIMYYLNTK